LIDDAFFRFRLNPSERLEKPSDIVCNWICTVDYDRLQIKEGALTVLDDKELNVVKRKLGILVE